LEKLNLRLKLKVKVGRGSKVKVSQAEESHRFMYLREYLREYPKVREGGKRTKRKNKIN